MNPFIVIGRIVKAHGIKGEVCVDFYADSPSILPSSSSGTVWLDLPPEAPRAYKIIAARQHHGRMLLTLENVPDRSAAELLRGVGVLVPRESLPALDPGEIYLADLPGFTVTLLDTGETLGQITAVDLAAGQEIWRITTPEGKEVLFPAVPQFVAKLDAEARSACIDPPPGLLELYI